MIMIMISMPVTVTFQFPLTIHHVFASSTDYPIFIACPIIVSRVVTSVMVAVDVTTRFDLPSLSCSQSL